MKMVNRKIAVILFLANSLIAFSQMDTAFWFVAPDVTKTHGSNEYYFRITTRYAADVWISQPANPLFIPKFFSLPANTVSSIDLSPYFIPINMVENTIPNGIMKCGFYITSTMPVTIYYEKGGTNNDAIFNLKGQNALGTNFVIPLQSAWNHVDPGWYGLIKRGFDIVASKNNTKVTITPSQDMVGHTAVGGSFTITLQKGETYSAIRDPLYNTGFLEGTIVTSDSAIAITLFDDSQYFPSIDGIINNGYDLTGDQIFPVSKTGKEYIGVSGKLERHNEHILITATQNGNTSITVNGIMVGNLTHIGDTFNIDSNRFFPYLGDPAFVYIQTSQDVYAYQVTGNGKELGASILPPIDRCTGSNAAGFTRSPFGNEINKLFFANILVQRTPAGADTAFKLIINGTEKIGAIKATDFVNLGTDWEAARIDLTTVVHDTDACLIKNDQAYFHLGIFNAAENVVEYGYFSDLNPVDLTAYIAGIYDTTLAVVCTGTPMTLIAVAANAKEYIWSPATYLSSTSIANPVATFDKEDSIRYKIVAKICSQYKTAYLTIKTKLSVEPPNGNPVFACYGSPVQPIIISNYKSGAKVDWYSDQQIKNHIASDNSGNFNTGNTAVGVYDYWATQMLDTHCISAPQKFTLTISQPKNQNAGSPVNTSICSNQSFDLYSALVNYDTGGYWIDSMQTGKVSGSIFNPSGIKGGMYPFAYSFPWVGCPVDTVVTEITTDIIPPEIKCRDTINRVSGSIGSSYQVVGNEMSPISVSDNCQYKLSNNINFDTSLNMAVIAGSTIITWMAVDSGLNMSSCNTILNIETISIPNTISPNGDGHNDFFDISFQESYPNAVLEIFDRWGKKIFISQPGYPDKWYGTVNGRLVPVDTYQYIVRNGDKVVQKGFISVVY
jgi:gliding motility-associated-like protein